MLYVICGLQPLPWSMSCVVLLHKLYCRDLVELLLRRRCVRQAFQRRHLQWCVRQAPPFAVVRDGSGVLNRTLYKLTSVLLYDPCGIKWLMNTSLSMHKMKFCQNFWRTTKRVWLHLQPRIRSLRFIVLSKIYQILALLMRWNFSFNGKLWED